MEDVLLGLYCGERVLLTGVPGLAKTLMIRSLAETLHLAFNRIQFTPLLLHIDAELLAGSRDLLLLAAALVEGYDVVDPERFDAGVTTAVPSLPTMAEIIAMPARQAPIRCRAPASNWLPPRFASRISILENHSLSTSWTTRFLKGSACRIRFKLLQPAGSRRLQEHPMNSAHPVSLASLLERLAPSL